MKKAAIFCTLYWFVVHMSLSLLGTFMPDHFFTNKRRYFKTFSWEHNGQFWQQYFKVKLWKDYLPDGSKMNPKVKSKRQLTNFNDKENIKIFIIETRRAEFIHLLCIIPGFIFYNKRPLIKYINIIYPFVANAPFIIAQRYNRPKLERLYKKL
ncbi:glycosyl-4,4'-diaponeurosporenoate acyltransferase CrtO family protein [Staphylococcus durrellii]|uniref:glycosyl-4,4'-diaponeurosporenoate acyltransferase CrtO family protein n=1 Tax=Staphylococcus durrellii TaxID=2781773 RepID=UPI00189D1975|nr:glycosyl-4,4'-diaponeurosporenoate acyltransferase [Staphylococcus durrellii]MBF7016005.1 glycosyl-4,4'-diaponeurosporenoate acyltransferase [Staphylococcus durrellii]